MGAAIRTETLCVGTRRQTKLKLHAWPLLFPPCLFLSFSEKYLSGEGKSNSAFRQMIRCIRHLTISNTYNFGNGPGAVPPLKNCRFQEVVKGQGMTLMLWMRIRTRTRKEKREREGKAGSSTLWWLSIKLTKTKCLLKTEEIAAAWSILLGFSKS